MASRELASSRGGASTPVYILSRVHGEKHTPDCVKHVDNDGSQRGKAQWWQTAATEKDTQVVGVSDSCTWLHSKLASASPGRDPEASEAGSAKVPLGEQQQSNGLMEYMIAEKGKGEWCGGCGNGFA